MLFQISDDPIHLCGICIESIETFHEFYERIQSVYKGSSTLSLSEQHRGHLSPDNNGDDSSRISFQDGDQFPDNWEVLSDYYSLEEEKEIPCKINESKSKDNREITEESVDSDESYKPALKRPKTDGVFSRRTSFHRRKLAPKTAHKVEAVERVLGQYYSAVTCPLCQDETFTLKTLDQHFQQFHEEEKSFILCCKKKFPLEDKFRLKRHLKIHLDPESCR